MNQFALRMFVRSLIAEAKDKKAKDEPKKSMKKEEKAPKSSGKLVDLKKELAALKQYKDELQAAKFAEKTASTEVEFSDLAKFAKELDALKAKGVALEKQVDDKIAELETRISDEKNKIKEMMGLSSEKKDTKKMMDEGKSETVKTKYGNLTLTQDEDGEWEYSFKGGKGGVGHGMTDGGFSSKEAAIKDFEKTASQELNEARFKKGTDIGKPGKGFEKIAKSAAKKYGSEEAGKKVAGAILKKVIKKESMLKEGQFIRIKNDFTLDGKNFKKGEVVTTAKEFNAIEAAAKSGKIQKSDFAIVVGNM